MSHTLKHADGATTIAVSVHFLVYVELSIEGLVEAGCLTVKETFTETALLFRFGAGPVRDRFQTHLEWRLFYVI